MSRPEHPGVPLPSSCLRDLRMKQDLYDEDPKRYEQREKEKEETLQQEEEENARWQESEEEKIQLEQKTLIEE